MNPLVKRVAKSTDKNPLNLLPAWAQEVERAVTRNFDEYNTLSFIKAAFAFLERTGAKVTTDDVLRDLKRIQ